jgi:hypothetical protein
MRAKGVAVIILNGALLGIALVLSFIVGCAYFMSYCIGMYEALADEEADPSTRPTQAASKSPRKRQQAKTATALTSKAPDKRIADARPMVLTPPPPQPRPSATLSANKSPELQAWYGTLLRTNQQERKDSESNRYSQFYAVIETSIGEQEVRGNDLERALKAADIEVGDRVGIRFHGLEDVVLPASKGKGNTISTKRKRYTAFKLKERSNSNAKPASGHR